MMKRETPTQWARVLEGAGIHSARDLARELDVSPQTAVRLLHGEQTSRDTIEAAATLLGISPEKVLALRGETSLPPFRLPPDADRLTQRQRAAVVAVVRAMLEPADAAANTQAPSGAAPPIHLIEAETEAKIDALLDAPKQPRRPPKGP